jgi:hypothetical protein
MSSTFFHECRPERIRSRFVRLGLAFLALLVVAGMIPPVNSGCDRCISIASHCDSRLH